MDSETRFLRDRVDSYQDTIDRIEPDIVMIDAAAFHASAAISLRRVADAMQRSERSSRALGRLVWMVVGLIIGMIIVDTLMML